MAAPAPDPEGAPAPARWETFSHEADVGVRGFGSTLEEAFGQAATALTAVVTDPEAVEPIQSVEIACEAPDRELLLVEWLNALVFEMATRGMLFSRYQVRIQEGRLAATALGEPVEVARHEPAVEVKGATCAELEVAEDAGLWRAQCVVDV